MDFHSWIPSDDECVEDAFLGELQVTVQHIALSEELVVRVKRGRNLLMRGPAVNPYVKVSLAPDPTKKYSFKTEVKVRSTDPVFDESITFAKVTERDTERKILKIAAFDDLNLNPYIGEINIKLNRIGLDLTVPIETRTIAGQQVHSIGAGTLLVCLSKSIAAKEVEPLALGIAAWHKTQAPAGESTIDFRDRAFADDVAKTNLTAILQQHGLSNVRSL